MAHHPSEKNSFPRLRLPVSSSSAIRGVPPNLEKKHKAQKACHRLRLAKPAGPPFFQEERDDGFQAVTIMLHGKATFMNQGIEPKMCTEELHSFIASAATTGKRWVMHTEYL